MLAFLCSGRCTEVHGGVSQLILGTSTNLFEKTEFEKWVKLYYQIKSKLKLWERKIVEYPEINKCLYITLGSGHILEEVPAFNKNPNLPSSVELRTDIQPDRGLSLDSVK